MDWKKLLEDLSAAGWSQAQIAERCGAAQTTVSELARGVTLDPRYGFGAALQKLHAEVTEQARAA
jgi:transcriptional regulator with XRE-family HTH domain